MRDIQAQRGNARVRNNGASSSAADSSVQVRHFPVPDAIQYQNKKVEMRKLERNDEYEYNFDDEPSHSSKSLFLSILLECMTCGCFKNSFSFGESSMGDELGDDFANNLNNDLEKGIKNEKGMKNVKTEDGQTTFLLTPEMFNSEGDGKKSKRGGREKPSCCWFTLTVPLRLLVCCCRFSADNLSLRCLLVTSILLAGFFAVCNVILGPSFLASTFLVLSSVTTPLVDLDHHGRRYAYLNEQTRGVINEVNKHVAAGKLDWQQTKSLNTYYEDVKNAIASASHSFLTAAEHAKRHPGWNRRKRDRSGSVLAQETNGGTEENQQVSMDADGNMQQRIVYEDEGYDDDADVVVDFRDIDML